MRRFSWQVLLGAALLLLSGLLCLLSYAIFRDAHDIGLYLSIDVAFVPIEVLLVTLIMSELLSFREKRSRLQKLNMVIGAFFSEVGVRLLAYLSDLDPELEHIRGELVIRGDWSHREFRSLTRRLGEYRHTVSSQSGHYEELRSLLTANRSFLLRLLENPTLLEQEAFTDLLRAVFHLTEELTARDSFSGLPAADLAHLRGDTERVYLLLAREWTAYMQHLRGNYPYLFSLAMRTNPFDREASPIIS